MLDKLHDGWLWVGLTAFTLYAFRAITLGREDVFRLVETHDEPKKLGVWEVTQETEDAVSAAALFDLAKGSNSLEIRRAATQILVDRFLHDSTAAATLRQDLDSKNPATHHRARTLATLLLRNGDAHLVRDYIPRDTPSSFHDNELNGPLQTRSSHDFEPSPGSNDPDDRTATLQRRTSNTNDPEEQENRRRRREAIVLNEGDRPVTQSDIIQRRMSG